MLKPKLPKLNRLKLSLLVAAAVVLLAVAGATGWYIYNVQPVTPTNTQSVSFNLPAGQGTKKIANRLEEAGLIRSSSAFLVFVSLHGVRAQLQAGTYSLSPSHSVSDIAAILSHGRIRTNLLVIPEGTTVKKIIDLAVAKGVDRAEMKSALSASYSYSFLPDGSLEGYLFPDSYNVNDKTSAKELVNEMLQNFQNKVPEKFTAGFKRRGLSLHQGVTLASIIEREVNTSADRPLVAQVFLKRLELGMALESDVTVEYAADLLGTGFSTSLDSPYNTYSHAGLPPGPISNPGISALEAVVSPARTDYLYFVTGTDGKTRYARDFAGHQRNISRYGVLQK